MGPGERWGERRLFFIKSLVELIDPREKTSLFVYKDTDRISCIGFSSFTTYSVIVGFFFGPGGSQQSFHTFLRIRTHTPKNTIPSNCTQRCGRSTTEINRKPQGEDSKYEPLAAEGVAPGPRTAAEHDGFAHKPEKQQGNLGSPDLLLCSSNKGTAINVSPTPPGVWQSAPSRQDVISQTLSKMLHPEVHRDGAY